MARTAIQTTTLIVFTALGCCLSPFLTGQDKNWLCVGGDRGCSRYSSLDQINRDNVDQLKVAWTFKTGEPDKIIECTPIVIDGIMYVTTNHSRVVALNAETGQQIWQYDPFAAGRPRKPLASGGVNRGCAFWQDPNDPPNKRIIHGTADGSLHSLDAATGKLDPNFGTAGVKDLREDLNRDISRLSYGPTSAPAIVGDIVVIGCSCGEGPGPAAPGDVRAFDVRTGKQVWRFHTVPREGEFGNETWETDSWKNRGGANAWGGVSVDVENSMVLVGLGSASFDFYGGDRKGNNLFANSTVALDAKTGKRIWHFQTLHHDVWDHDTPIYPNLITVTRDGKKVPAVAQVTKTGYVFVFDRKTGKPLFEVVEQTAPESDVPGEQTSPTQPVPVKPPPFCRTAFTDDLITDVSQRQRDFVKEQLKNLRYGQQFMPPSFEGTVVTPGFHGGATWSGASFDPKEQVLFVNANNMPNVLTMVKAPEGSKYPYRIKGYIKFLDQDGYPAIKPPWGTLNAIDMNSGEIRWQVPLGEFPELTAKGIPQTGTENFGGTIATAGGLVFIGGTMDEKFRAFDQSNGKVLWETKLPAGGYATPCTYSVNGKQYVVIAAGGAGKLGTKPGEHFIAYTLQ